MGQELNSTELSINKTNKNRKNVFITILIISLLISSFVVWYIFFKIKDGEYDDVLSQIKEQENISGYIKYIYFTENDNDDPTILDDSKVYPYFLVVTPNDEFEKLSIEEKQTIITEFGEFMDSRGFIDCGYNKYCNVEEINFISSEKDFEIFSFDTYSSSIEHNYYDENNRYQNKILTSNSSNSTKTNSTSTASMTTSSKLTLEETSCNIDGDYIYAKGFLKNNTNSSVSFVKVHVNYTDASGQIIDTDYTYVVGSEGLAPGSRKSFELMSNYSNGIKKCNYKIVE